MNALYGIVNKLADLDIDLYQGDLPADAVRDLIGSILKLCQDAENSHFDADTLGKSIALEIAGWSGATWPIEAEALPPLPTIAEGTLFE